MVTAIIPCRNEEKFIADCLDSIINQDFKDLEVLIIDGMSEDKTREIVNNYCRKYSFVKLLDNIHKTTPFAMNIGIKNAKGDIVMKIDAHSVYPKNYVLKSVDCLNKNNADGVGGVLQAMPSENTFTARAIALALSDKFGSASSFKTGAKKIRPADAVAFGAFKKEVFGKVGMYNEKLERSQDIEFNLRLKKAGGKILLDPEIICYYYPKSNIKDFFLHNIEDGIWAIYPLKFTRTFFSLRHYIPLLFILGLIVCFIFRIFFPVFLYLFLTVIFSAKVAFKQKDIRYLFLMPVIFFARHFGYGIGSIIGLFKLIL